MPPMDGLQDIWPSVSTLWVSNSVLDPVRAAASAASVPAWPPPITITSNSVGNSIGGGEFYAMVPRGTEASDGFTWNNLDVARMLRRSIPHPGGKRLRG